MFVKEYSVPLVTGWVGYIVSPLTLKNEFIWSDITAQTVTLGANLLVMVQTIPQNAHHVFFFNQKLH